MKTIYKGAAYLSLAASIWGGTYVASKFAMESIPPFTLMLMRYLLAGITLIWLCRRQNIPVVPSENKGLLWMIGFAGYFLSIAAQFIGTKLSSAHMGAVITTLAPVFQSIFAILILKEAMNFRQVIAAVISLIGVFTIVGIPGDTDSQVSLGGIFSLLLAGILWGYYSVLSRKASRSHTPLQITTWGILVASLPTALAAYFEWDQWVFASLFHPPVLFSVVYISIIATAVAFLYWNKGLALVPSHNAGLFFFFQPLVGTLLGWLLLNEALTLSFFAGSLLVLAGVYYTMSNSQAES